MSAQPDISSHIDFGDADAVIVELPTDISEAWKLAQETPEHARNAEVPAKILFLASQIGMKATQDWRIRAEWTSVYIKAIGPSSDY